MAQVTEAIYANGVLTPQDQLGLREAQRVCLIVEPIDDDTDRADGTAGLRRRREGIERMKFFLREPLPSWTSFMVALDTNVLIYACDKQVALDLVSNARDGVLLWQVACDFVAASRKLSRQGFTNVDALPPVWNAALRYLLGRSSSPCSSGPA